MILYGYVSLCSESIWAEVIANHWAEGHVALTVLRWVLVRLKLARVSDRSCVVARHEEIFVRSATFIHEEY